jgi:hypothetical protein
MMEPFGDAVRLTYMAPELPARTEGATIMTRKPKHEHEAQFVVWRSWDGAPYQAVTYGSELTCRATMAQCAPMWRRQGYSVKLTTELCCTSGTL